jgi:antitoxin YefM
MNSKPGKLRIRERAPMTVVTTDYARKNLGRLMDQAERNRRPIAIAHRGRHAAVVLVSAREWRSMEETLYLLGNRENARVLRKGIAELEAGKGIERDIIPVKRRRR